MKNIIITNYQTAVAETLQSAAGNKFTVKPIVPQTQADKCAAAFVEVAPGESAYGYHWHEENEEIFYVIAGEALVKTESGEIRLRAGDAIAFPANEKGAHVMMNPSKTEKLVYLDFGTANKPDIVHFAGTGTGLVVSRSGVLPFSENH